jgi:hypothetical protein
MGAQTTRRFCRSLRQNLYVDYRTHPYCQTFASKRLFEQLDVGVEPALMDDGVLRISGYEQDPDVGHHHPCSVGELAAVHPRHHDVGKEQIDPQICLRDDSQRGGSVPR